MDKYQKMIIGFLIVGVAVVLIFFFFTSSRSGSGVPSSDDTSFPYFIFFPSWVAIFIPIIAHKRQEEKNKEGELRNQLEEEKKNAF